MKLGKKIWESNNTNVTIVKEKYKELFGEEYEIVVTESLAFRTMFLTKLKHIIVLEAYGSAIHELGDPEPEQFFADLLKNVKRMGLFYRYRIYSLRAYIHHHCGSGFCKEVC